MDWWVNILTLQVAPASDDIVIGNDSIFSNETVKNNNASFKEYNKPNP